VYHTTETRGVPGFRSGATAPHYLYHPVEDRWVRYAEYEDGYVGTLKGHTKGGHGNCKAFQVEIVAYSDRDASAGGIWVGDFSDHHYQELTRFWVWARDRYGIGDNVTPTPDGGWLSGTGSPYRLTDQQWETFSGLTAHGAVPRNSHWDTGILDLERITTGDDDMAYDQFRAAEFDLWSDQNIIDNYDAGMFQDTNRAGFLDYWVTNRDARSVDEKARFITDYYAHLGTKGT
jgi:hypothetical protein